MITAIHQGITGCYTQVHYLIKNKKLMRSQLAKRHTFEVAARHCSFALAAEELSINPSAVSLYF